METEEYLATLISSIQNESFKIKQSYSFFLDYYKTVMKFKTLKIVVHSRKKDGGVYSISINGEDVNTYYFIDIVEDLLDYYNWQKYKQKCGKLRKIINTVLKGGSK